MFSKFFNANPVNATIFTFVLMIVASIIGVSSAFAEEPFTPYTEFYSIVKSSEIIEPGFRPAGDNAMFTVGLHVQRFERLWFEMIRFQAFNQRNAFEHDIAAGYQITLNERLTATPQFWVFDLHAVNDIDNIALTTQAREIGVQLDYELPWFTAGLYLADITGSGTNNGQLYKFSAESSYEVEHTTLSWGWRGLVCINDDYFINGSGITHAQGQLWGSTQATDWALLRLTLTYQVALDTSEEFGGAFSTGANAAFKFIHSF